MKLARYRLPISLAAILVWILITVFPAFLPHPEVSLGEAASGGVALNILLAGTVLGVIAIWLGWSDLGFNAPRPWSSLRLLWLPGLYLALFYIGDLALGFPPTPVVVTLLINTVLVGFSEEIAFRGVMFRGLLSRLGVWPAVIISSLTFGVVHVLNVLTTGNLLFASVQALAAAMTGFAFAAYVIRMKSIIPVMILHMLWDFGTLLLVVQASNMPLEGGGTVGDAAATQPISPLLLLVPLAFNLPNFLYALFLLRKVRGDGPAVAASPTPEVAGLS